MNRRLPEITESVEDLKVLLRQAKKKHEIQRLTVLHLLKSGGAKNRKQAADFIGVTCNSVGAWLKIYETEGLAKFLERGFAPGRVSALTEEQQAHLRRELQKPEGFHSYVQIQEYIAETFGVEMKYTTVSAMVHEKWGAKLKVPRPSHEKKTP